MSKEKNFIEWARAQSPIVLEVCDRLNCKLKGCYGWDLCRQAREVCTHEEWEKLMMGLFSKDDSSLSKIMEGQ